MLNTLADKDETREFPTSEWNLNFSEQDGLYYDHEKRKNYWQPYRINNFRFKDFGKLKKMALIILTFTSAEMSKRHLYS